MPDIKAQNETALASVKAIYDAADEANTLLDGMQTAATQAGTTLTQIYQDAEDAKGSAENASEYAARALGNLSTVQSVAETLTWITQHGTMTLTSDVALDPTHVYFVRDNNGDYHVGSYYYSVVTEPDVTDIATYYELTIDESLNNYVGTHLALDSEGLWLLPAASGVAKVLIATGAGSIYTTAGTYLISASGVINASFRADGATIGQNLAGRTRSEINADGLKVIRNDNGTDTQIVNLGYGEGVSSGGSLIYAPYITLGTRASGSSVGASSVAEGYQTTASGAYSHAEGKNTRAGTHQSHAEGENTSTTGIASHVEGYYNTITGASYSHAEGMNNHITANGLGAHVEGKECWAQNYYAHAEGQKSNASGYGSHAEGYDTTASGYYSHAEGDTCSAVGNSSHANGYFAIADRRSHTVIGEYNTRDQQGTDATERGEYAFIIGNGSSTSNRSNALAVTWGGDVHMYLDDSAASGTDYEIITALTALGWNSDVVTA